ncbi:MAG: hypothetical protein JNL34_05780 [Anaerolineae bacterium]|nr:hypothetical protein [Anaerolineae bacterium]
MNHARHSSRLLIVSVSVVVLMALLFSSLMLVTAQETDGRVNPVEHVGGAAVFCVDADFNPAAHWTDGGIRVLDAEGQELLFAAAEVIQNSGRTPGEPVQVGTGANAFGPLELLLLPNESFQLNGTDEWGKSFEFVWGGCGYTVEAPATTAPTIVPEPTCIPPQDLVDGTVAPATVIDPCDLRG